MHELTAVRNTKYIHLQLIIVSSTLQYQHKSRYIQIYIILYIVKLYIKLYVHDLI